MTNAKNPNTSTDTITRFYFDDCDMRGEMITLNKSIIDAVAHQKLPASAQALLAQFLSSAALLAGILKFEGLLTIQIRGDGDIPLIMAEATHERHLRGIVKLRKDAQEQPIDGKQLEGKSLRDLVGNGVLTLTIDPEQGQRYQGIVPIEGENIAQCLSYYFNQSEQLTTKLWFFSDATCAGGFFLQALPASAEQGKTARTAIKEQWNTLELLADTLTAEESLTLTHPVQLRRLFHEFELRIVSNIPTLFRCSCSQERSENALIALGKADAYALLEEQQTITIDCQFCGQDYDLNQEDLDRIFTNDGTLH